MELEYLIERDDENLALITRDEASALYALLVSDFGFKLRSQSDPFRLSMETKMGYVTLKPDFAYHLIEVSLPPRSEPKELEYLLGTILDLLDQALTRLRFHRAPYSAYPRSSIRYDMVESDRLDGFMKYAQSARTPDSLFSNPNYPAIISSVQVHLNILSDTFFPLLPHLYEPEWKIVSVFSNSRAFDDEIVGCARMLFYEMTLGQNYFLKTIPPVIPVTWDDYARALEKTPVYDDRNGSGIPRDYTLIRPREFGSVEFRSACSQTTLSSIMAVCASRVLQMTYAILGLQGGHQTDDGKIRDALFKWAKCPPQELENAEFENAVEHRLRVAAGRMSYKWRCYLSDQLK